MGCCLHQSVPRAVCGPGMGSVDLSVQQGPLSKTPLPWGFYSLSAGDTVESIARITHGDESLFIKCLKPAGMVLEKISQHSE